MTVARVRFVLRRHVDLYKLLKLCLVGQESSMAKNNTHSKTKQIILVLFNDIVPCTIWLMRMQTHIRVGVGVDLYRVVMGRVLYDLSCIYREMAPKNVHYYYYYIGVFDLCNILVSA